MCILKRSQLHNLTSGFWKYCCEDGYPSQSATMALFDTTRLVSKSTLNFLGVLSYLKLVLKRDNGLSLYILQMLAPKHDIYQPSLFKLVYELRNTNATRGQ